MKHVALVLLMLGLPIMGCQSSAPEDARVVCPGGPSCPRTFLSVQAANGARRDATLRAAHFDDSDHLNSLGRAKLDGMLTADRVSDVLTVYIDAPTAEAKRAVVLAYMKDRGAAEGTLAVKTGPNPDVSFQAGPQIASLPKTDTAPAADAQSQYPAPAANNPLATVGAALQAVSK